MSLQALRFQVSLTLAAPILSHSSGALDYGLDAATRRDHAGRPCLSGHLIKGNLRHAWEALERITGLPSRADIAAWLGEPSPPDSRDQARPGRLRFAHAWSDLDWQGGAGHVAGRRFRIAIDPVTGAVADGALQVIESPYPAGQTVNFTGIIDVDADAPEADAIERMLGKGLGFVPALGALKGNGFGRVLALRIERRPRPMARSGLSGDLPAAVVTAGRIGLRIVPESPFCFARPAIGGNNHFEAESFIPGGAIKAALARRLEQEPRRWPRLRERLSTLRLSHALPVPRGKRQRPMQLPLSLVAAAGAFHDIAGSDAVGLIDGQAPLFNIDWKAGQWRRAAALYNPEPAQPRRLLDIRTAIDATRGSAKDGQLFSIETIDPEGGDWLANLDVGGLDGAAPDPAECRALFIELADLAKGGLSHLGKTKATATLALEAAYPYTCPQADAGADCVSLYLQSAARLLPTDFDAPASNGGEALQTAYAAAWDALSGGSLALTRFYARQQLLGGRYWHTRYHGGGGDYRPQLFTSPGSVFVLRITDPEPAARCLRQWQRSGLPQLADAPGGGDWRHNPWIAANGYGEVAFDIRPTDSGAGA
jgi:hypothetical protein